MPTTKASINAAIRSRVGDDDATNYMCSDAALNELILSATRMLVKYARKQSEDTSLTGNGSTSVFTIPAAINPTSIDNYFLRSNGDPSTDREITTVRTNGSQIYLPTVPSSSQSVAIWYHTAYVLDADTLPEFAVELLTMLGEAKWYGYAIARRTDFEQWAATSRADTSIGEIRQAKKDVEQAVSELASVIGSTIKISNIWS